MVSLTDGRFLNENWGLTNDTAKQIYRDIVKPLRRDRGILDAHTHFSAEQIVRNEPIPDIFRAMILETDPRWKNFDHYIGQLAGKHGVSLEYLKSSRPNKEKWQRVAEVFPLFTLNPVYTWTHLELMSLGIYSLLDGASADTIWDLANEALQRPEHYPQKLFGNAKVICTTDDPVDDLRYHKQASGLSFKLLPTFRPDNAMNIFKGEDWKKYVDRLFELTGEKPSLQGLITALEFRHDFFVENGCKASDHGLEVPYGRKPSEPDADRVFRDAYERSKFPSINSEGAAIFISYLMNEFARMDKAAGIVTQIHFGPVRSIDEELLKKYGSDIGTDVSTQHFEIVRNLSPLLNQFGRDNSDNYSIVLYCIDPTHYATVATLARAVPCVRYGSAWWFNDSLNGMNQHLNYMLQAKLWSDFTGMVCDGRKPISFGSRHDMSDRNICSVVGAQYEAGSLPGSLVQQVVEGMIFENQNRYFKFDAA